VLSDIVHSLATPSSPKVDCDFVYMFKLALLEETILSDDIEQRPIDHEPARYRRRARRKASVRRSTSVFRTSTLPVSLDTKQSTERGGLAIIPVDVGYAICAGDSTALERAFTTKQRK
jgi:hypothetical protein